MNILFNNNLFYSSQSDGQLVTPNETPQNQPLYLMGYDIRQVSIEMPIKQTRQILKALPYAIEEQLANDVESNHIVYTGKQGTLACAVIINHKRIQEIIEQYNPSAIYDFAQAIPTEDNTINIAILNEIACVMSKQNPGITIPYSMLQTIIEREMSNQADQVKIQLFSDNADEELLIAQLLNLSQNVTKGTINELLIAIKQGGASNKLINLLTARYAKKIESKKSNLDKFKFPMAMAASLFALSIAYNWTQANSFNAQADVILNNSKEFYTSMFPDDNPSRMKRSFNEYIKASKGASSLQAETFSSTLGVASGVISTNSTLSIDSIRFTNNKALEFNLTANTIADLDKLKKQLSEVNITTEIASANQDGSKIKGVIKVSRNG